MNIPSSVTSIGREAFSGCSGLTFVSILNSVTYIGDGAFLGCSSLTAVSIPNSVTYIGEQAFSGCSSLTLVTIPESIKVIRSKVWKGCTSLENMYCYIESVPTTSSDAFEGASIGSARLHVPANAIADYMSIAPWSGFGKHYVLNDDGETKCSTPTIKYNKGTLEFACNAPGAVFVSSITDTDVGDRRTQKISLGVTYHIRVYATATGYDDSDVATATLCWIDSNPKTDGVTNSVAEVEAQPVLIQCNNGILTVTSEDCTSSLPVCVYNLSGIETAVATLTDGIATLDTHMKCGEIAIIKVGEKAIRVVVR